MKQARTNQSVRLFGVSLAGMLGLCSVFAFLSYAPKAVSQTENPEKQTRAIVEAVPPAPPRGSFVFDARNHPPSIDLTYKNEHPPRYPMKAVAAHHEGMVLVDVEIDANSRVRSVRVEKSSGYPELDDAAVAAAHDWKFEAGMRDGKPIGGFVRCPVTFSM